MYDTADYARNRLVGTIVRFGSTPVVVKDAMNHPAGIMMVVNKLFDGESLVVPIKELNLSPVPLGWVNTGRGGPIYLARIPKRQDWKQGLREGNATCLYPDNAAKPIPLSMNTVLKCITGSSLVSYEDAIERCVRGENKAFHREWAFIDGQLYNKWNPVGRVVDGTPVLFEECKYLESRLYEDKGYANLAEAWA